METVKKELLAGADCHIPGLSSNQKKSNGPTKGTDRNKEGGKYDRTGHWQDKQ